MFENINEISVLVTAVLAAAVGSIWYSPLLFGSVWMKSIGHTLEDGEFPKDQMLVATCKGVLAQVVLFFILAKYIAWAGAADISLWMVGVSFLLLLGAQTIQGVIWEKRALAYFWVQMGYLALVIFGGIAVIAYWPW